MMGVGKSTVGKNLAQKLSYNFVDIDRTIESREGSTINLIFKNKSESYFRKLENEISLEKLKKKNTVISLGGGAFLNKSIRREVKNTSGQIFKEILIFLFEVFLVSFFTKFLIRKFLIKYFFTTL